MLVSHLLPVTIIMLRIFMKYCIPHLKKKVAQVDHSCILTISELAGASVFGSKKQLRLGMLE